MQVQEQLLTLCFPTPIWRFTFTGYEAVNDAIRRELAALDWNVLDEENRAAFHPLDTFREDRFITVEQVPAMRVVLEHFVVFCNVIADERKWDMGEQSLVLGNYWIHATDPGDLTQVHRHVPAVLSGVYYVDTPEGSGDLIFVDVNPHHGYGPRPAREESDPICGPEAIFESGEGSMIVFPAWLPHKVPRNTSGARRVSISFNAVVGPAKEVSRAE